MDRNDSLVSEEKKDKNRQKIMISLLVTAALLVADMYVMIHMPVNYMALVAVTALFLASVYFFIHGFMKELDESKRVAEEQYEAVSKSGKASYLLLKKTYEQLGTVEDSFKQPAEDIITAQKALAKVTITRNKENADAIMNSNDRVFEKLCDLEEKEETGHSDLWDEQRDMLEASVREIMQRQQEMTTDMKELEASLKSGLLQMMDALGAMEEKIGQQLMQQRTAEPEIREDASEPEEFDFSDLSLTDEPEIIADSEPEMIEKVAEPEEFDFSDLSLTGEPEMTEELTEPEEFDFSDLSLTDEPEMTEELTEPKEFDFSDLLLTDEPELTEESLTEEPVEEEPLTEEILTDEPEQQKESPKMPDMSDPHKLMTPDEIAALIASM